MKIEFNKNGFSAEMNSLNETSCNEKVSSFKFNIQENKVLLFGILAFIISVITLPFTLLLNFNFDILQQIFNTSIQHWITILFIVSTVMILLSLVCGIFSISLYKKTQKTDTTRKLKNVY